MWKACAVSFSLTLAVVYIPFAADIFNVTALNLKDWEIVLIFSFIPLIIGELYKMIFKNK